ncbi:cache domain-containing sensor histidine kinase [Eisenbergiella sp.]
MSKLSIKKQFQIILGCMAALCLILSVVSYTALDRLLLKNAASYARNTSQKFDGEMNYLFQRIDSIFNTLLFDRNIEGLLHTPYSSETQKYVKELLVQFSSYSIMNQDISDIALVSSEMSWSNVYDAATLRRLSAQMEGSHGLYSFGFLSSPLTDSNRSREKRMVFGCNVYGMHEMANYGKYQGSLILSIDLKKAPIILPTQQEGTTYFLLVDNKENLFSFNCPEDITRNLLKSCEKKNALAAGETVDYDTHDYLIYVTPVSDMGYRIISAIDKRQLHQEVLQTTVIITFIITASLLLLAFFMYTLLHNMVSPLNQLSCYIGEIRQKPLNKERKPLHLDGCTEIHTLNDSFHELLDEQQTLTRQLYNTTVSLYETELEKKQAELEFLRSQINPHFLYNTLESIRDIALEEQVPEIAGMSDALARLFRYNVKGQAIVPLSQELEITMAYLDIQKARFPGKLEVICSVRPEAGNVPIMKFLLQPLVENAVFHGIEPALRKGTLFIGARVQENRLLITIQDDGIGIPPDQLAQLQAHLADISIINTYTQQHVGILNVAHRILLNYGKDYGLTLDSSPGEGTRILLTLPADAAQEPA